MWHVRIGHMNVSGLHRFCPELKDDVKCLNDFLKMYQRTPKVDKRMRRIVDIFQTKAITKQMMVAGESDIMSTLGMEYEDRTSNGMNCLTNRQTGCTLNIGQRVKQSKHNQPVRKTGFTHHHEVQYGREKSINPETGLVKNCMKGIVACLKMVEEDHGFDGWLGVGAYHYTQLEKSKKQPKISLPCGDDAEKFKAWLLKKVQDQSSTKEDVISFITEWETQKAKDTLEVTLCSGGSTASPLTSTDASCITVSLLCLQCPRITAIHILSQHLLLLLQNQKGHTPVSFLSQCPILPLLKIELTFASTNQLNSTGDSEPRSGRAKMTQPKHASKQVAPKEPAVQVRTVKAHAAALKKPRRQPPPTPSPVTPSTPKKSSPKKVNMLADDANVGMTCSVASRASPRSDKIMANGQRRYPCCSFVLCEMGAFNPIRIGLGEHEGWENYPRKCSGCMKSVRDGKQQKSDEKDNITRCNIRRPVYMCQNAYNHRDDPCVECYCFDCHDIVKRIENPNGSPTKKIDEQGRNIRVSSRKRKASNQLNPGETMLVTGEIVPAKHGRKD